MNTENPTPQFLTAEEASKHKLLKSCEINSHPVPGNESGMTFFDWDFSWVLLMEGDTHINEDLYGQWIDRAIDAAGNKDILKNKVAVVVVGNLVVEGRVTPDLYVSKNLRCEVLENCSERVLWVEGDVDIKYLMRTRYDGISSFGGSLRVPYILRDTHHYSDYLEGDAVTIQVAEIADWEDSWEKIKTSDFKEHLLSSLYKSDNDRISLDANAFESHVVKQESPFKKSSSFHPSNEQ